MGKTVYIFNDGFQDTVFSPSFLSSDLVAEDFLGTTGAARSGLLEKTGTYSHITKYIPLNPF